MKLYGFKEIAEASKVIRCDGHHLQVVLDTETGELSFREHASENSYTVITYPYMTVLNLYEKVSVKELRRRIKEALEERFQRAEEEWRRIYEGI